MPKKISSGCWGSNLQWEIYRSDILPPAELCTAVLCVAILDERIVLAQVERGWGMLGGHIENGETIEQALVRELYEEGGYTVAPHSGPEVLASQSFAIEDIASLNTIDQEVIEQGWELYRADLKNSEQAQ